jgi:hypothetical protein
MQRALNHPHVQGHAGQLNSQAMTETWTASNQQATIALLLLLVAVRT